MVRGIDSFRDWFRRYEEQYAIIGGTACDLLVKQGEKPARYRAGFFWFYSSSSESGVRVRSRNE